MYSIRKWMFKPKKTDTSLLAQFFYSDEELNMVATELDSFDGRKDPERCSALVNQLRMCQDKVLTILEKIMDEANPTTRSNRDFRVKFPDDVLQESLAGQLWFGAECLAAGSSIMNREVESASMRPLAKALTRHLDYVRSTLRDQCLKNSNTYTEKIKEALRIFDRLFAEFELSYVSAMVPVKTMKEYDTLQEVIVLFCETTQRALRLTLLTQDMIDDYDPALMFTIPRLAIVCGLLIYPDGPLNPDMDPMNMSEMFRPFQTLLYKIRELLWTLSADELWMLEKLLCSSEEPGQYRKPILPDKPATKNGECIDQLDPLTSGHMYSTLGNGGTDLPVHLRSEVSYDVCRMSQSPSIVTIVANPNYKGSDKDGGIGEGAEGEQGDEGLEQQQLQMCDHLKVDSASPGIIHQDSADSGNHSDENTAGHMSLSGQAQADSRMLRHSLSWPESRHRSNIASRLSDAAEYLDDGDEDAVPRAMCTHRSSTHEFNFHLPINTETVTSYAFEQSDIPERSGDEPDLKVDCRPSPLQRIFITSDSCDGSDCEDSSPISFVTETLNEVFVTDTAFRGVTHNKKSSSKVANENAANELESSHDSSVNADVLKTRDSNVDASTNSSVAIATNAAVIQDSAEQDTKEQDTKEVGRGKMKCKQKCVKCQNKNSTRTAPEASVSQVCKEVCSCPGQAVGTNSCDSMRACSKCQVPSSSSSSASNGTRTASLTNRQTETVQPSSPVKESSYVCSSTTCSSCNSPTHSVNSVDADWDRQRKLRKSKSTNPKPKTLISMCFASTDTSSYNSDCQDDEEIALAIQAAEMAARHEARSRFKSSTDLIHRLFVCISGVADQLQTNYASDLRHILKCVFQVNASESFIAMDESSTPTTSEPHTMETGNEEVIPEEVDEDVAEANENMVVDRGELEEEDDETRVLTENLIAAGLYPSPGTSPPEPEVSAPSWVPDDLVQQCTSCMVPFTFVRRRHHCRNCGKIFCGRCSSNTVPLPHYGHTKPVRVCNHCFIFQVNPFTMSS